MAQLRRRRADRRTRRLRRQRHLCHSRRCASAIEPAGAGGGMSDENVLDYAVEDDDKFPYDVLAKAHDLRVYREARRKVDAEERPPVRSPEILTLRERLARPRKPVAWRLDGWQPQG